MSSWWKRKRWTYRRFGLVEVLSLAMWVSCQHAYTPKPRGYFRIAFPEKNYQTYQSGCPFVFSFPTYSEIETDRRPDAPPCWFDIVYPEFNARLHLSYIPVRNSAHLDTLIEDARKFAYAHVVRATAIREERIQRPDADVFGVFYDIGGDVASGAQFFLTDSTAHYLRGALYFNERPRADSIRPVADFLRADMDLFVRTLHWR